VPRMTAAAPSARAQSRGLRRAVPRGLLEERWRSATRAMEEAGYDALLIAGRGMIMQYGNVHYFGGYPLFLFHGYAVLTPGEPAALVLNRRDQELAANYGVGDLVWRAGGDEDITYGLRPSAGLAQPLSELLSHRGLAAARIGIVGVGESMPVSEYRALTALLPDVDLDEADALTATIKAVKSEAELALFRDAVELVDDAFSLFPGLVQAGADELEITAEVERAVRAHGVLHSITRVLPGLMNARPPISRQLVPNELVTCYVEFVAPNGFWAEKGACFALGELPARWQEVYDASELAFEAAERLLTPGTRVSDVAAAVWDVAREAGCDIGMQIGHGVGVDHDLPLLDLHSDLELAEGMVIAVHPLMQDGEYGAFTIDQYTVTGSGPLRHSRFPRRLYRV
jgi:Xaa-Pro aminopeptidase